MLAAPSTSLDNPLEDLHAVVLAFLEASVQEVEARYEAARDAARANEADQSRHPRFTAPSQINKNAARDTKVEPLKGCSMAMFVLLSNSCTCS